MDKTCNFATYLTESWVACGKPATQSVQLLPYYDRTMCDEHAEIFTEEDGWVKHPLPLSE